MKTRVVKQYCCEFCRKRGLSASHMAKHEASCTLNPNRVCRVCKMVEGIQKPMAELRSLLPQRSRSYYEEHGFGPHEDAVHTEVNEGVKKLREACSNCPACILAALRQSNIPVPVATDFNFTTEMRAIWDDINDSNALADARACRYG